MAEQLLKKAQHSTSCSGVETISSWTSAMITLFPSPLFFTYRDDHVDATRDGGRERPSDN
jgi:hypothetical protein